MMTEVPPNSILRRENISSLAGTFLPAMGFGCTPGDIPLYARRALTQQPPRKRRLSFCPKTSSTRPRTFKIRMP